MSNANLAIKQLPPEESEEQLSQAELNFLVHVAKTLAVDYTKMLKKQEEKK